MKTTLTLMALVALAAFAPAQTKPTHKPVKHVQTTIKCPVTGEAVNIASATKNHMYADYKGNRYFFCCGDCPSMFKKDPAKYAKMPHIKTPKKAHKA